jgi:selenocysteine lyase/cysteine desulfurase
MSPTSSTIADTRDQLRQAMPITRQWAYFDHAAVAPISQPAALALRRWLEEATHQGDTAWPRWAQALSAARRSAAHAIGAHEDEIALVPNTTTGINLVAGGVDWQPGDNVVILADEFPSNAYPWLNLAQHGVETRRLPTDQGMVDLQQLADLCDGRTRIVSVSWIAYASGCRRDLSAISRLTHDRGALLLVDAIQGIGAFPLDVNRIDIDFLAADGHKWQLGPEGAGFAYIRRVHLTGLRPHGVGWHSVVHASDFSHIELKLKESAARYEGGSHNMAGFLAWGASLDLLNRLGIENIAAAILDFTDKACAALEQAGAEILSPRKPEKKSGIVTFDLPGRDMVALRRQCLKQNVVLSCRGGHLRISPHAYNNAEDLQRLLAALK